MHDISSNPILLRHSEYLMKASLLRTLIIDDDSLARFNLQILLDNITDVELVGTCSNASEASEYIQQIKPDLIFLSIEMSPVTGFQILSLIDPALMPKVILVTTSQDFALQAYNANAVDYLLKPVQKNRLEVAIKKAQTYSNYICLYKNDVNRQLMH